MSEPTKREIMSGLLRTADYLLETAVHVVTDVEKLDWLDGEPTTATSSWNLLSGAIVATRALLDKFKAGDPDRTAAYSELLADITKECDEARQADDASGPEVGDTIILDKGLERRVYRVYARLNDGSLVGRSLVREHEMVVIACLPPLMPERPPERPMYYTKLTDVEHIHFHENGELDGKQMWTAAKA